MRRNVGESRDDFNARCFKARSSSMYQNHRRRAKEAHLEMQYTIADMRMILSASLGTSCIGCSEKITPKTMSIDHRVPIARGGRMEIGNLWAMCQRCNKCKGKMSMGEFMQLVELLKSWPPEASRDVRMRLSLAGNMLPVLYGKRKAAKNGNESSGKEKADRHAGGKLQDVSGAEGPDGRLLWV